MSLKWNLLKYFNERESWGDPDKMSIELLVLLDQLRASLPAGYKIKVHRGYSDKNANSLHSRTPCVAVDFHIVGCGFLEAEYHVKNFLHNRHLISHVEYGIYPDWNSPGFHIGLQDNGGLWAGQYVTIMDNGKKKVKQKFISYELGIAYSKEKFKA